ncbi:hypothetical protein RI367_007748 [Sorochytrium milnesiophthora]
MGQGESRVLDGVPLGEVPLSAPDMPLVVFSEHFCLSQETRLVFNLAADYLVDIVVKDIEDTLWFSSTPARYREGIKIQDINNDIIFSIQRQPHPSAGLLNIYSGNSSSNSVGFASPGRDEVTWLHVKHLAGQRVQLILFTSWSLNGAFVFSGNPQNGGKLIARLQRQYPKPNYKSTLAISIAPGVDVAYVVAIAFLYDLQDYFRHQTRSGRGLRYQGVW